LHVVEIHHTAPDPPFAKKAVDVYFPPGATNDFPVVKQVSKKHGIVYLAAKYGFIHLYDLESGACVYMNCISGETFFVTAEHGATNCIIGVNKKGQVLGVNVNEQTIIPYILTILNNTELAFKLASRGNLPDADDLYVEQYPERSVRRSCEDRGQLPQEYDALIFVAHPQFLQLSAGDSTHSPSDRV
jgi:clathrin heavy chain